MTRRVRSPSPWGLAVAGALLWAVAVPRDAAGTGSRPPGLAELDVAVDEGRLTLDLQGARLGEVLRTIAEQAGIRVSVEGEADRLISAAFAGVPLDEGVARLTRGGSLVLIYAATGNGPGQARLAEVRVYGGSGRATRAAASAPAPAAAPGRPVPKSAREERAERLEAVASLPRLGQDAAVAGLSHVLAEETDAAVRARAVWALGRVKGAPAVGVIETALGDPDLSVRLPAVQVLRRVAGAGSVPTLGRLVASDPDPSVRRAAAFALAALRTPDALHALVPALSDPSEMVRQAAQAANRSMRQP
jgi:hypothetical protein